MWRVGLFGLAMFASFSVAHAQINGLGGNGYNGTAFGTNIGGLGNAGGFGTGSGFSNATTNSNYFGSTVVGSARSYGGFSNGGYGNGLIQAAPVFDSNSFGAFGSMYGAPGTAGIGSPLPFGVSPGLLPPNVTADLLSGQTSFSPFGSAGSGIGYTDLGAAISYAGMGYGGFGYPGMAYPGMVYPGMVADGTINGMASGSFDASGNALPTPRKNKAPVKAGADLKGNSDADNGRSPSDENAKIAPTRRRPLVLDDGVPRATVTAVRIQNRLNNLKSPNLSNVKVLMNGRTATLSGSVDSQADEQLAVRLVGLEPGVVTVKSELQFPGAKQD